MSEPNRPSGPQFHADRPAEQEAVRTTIVGGRPPGPGQSIGKVPRGIEILVKKAVVDPDFKAVLLQRRAAAAEMIGLELDPAEAMMLAAVPAEQLEAIIARTSVPEEHRRAFLGKAAAVMLAALGASAQGCYGGSRPDLPDRGARPDRPEMPTKGIRPDKPDDDADGKPAEGGAKPAESPEKLAPRGIRPDLPEPKSGPPKS